MWRELTTTDLLGVMNAVETAAYQTAAAGDGQDPAADAIEAVVNQCRGYIADNPANRLGDGLTLPERAILPALHLIRAELLARLDIEMSKDRADARKEALRFFERVADGKVAVESPATPTADAENAPRLDTLSSRDRIATREKLAGL